MTLTLIWLPSKNNAKLHFSIVSFGRRKRQPAQSVEMNKSMIEGPVAAALGCKRVGHDYNEYTHNVHTLIVTQAHKQ